MKVHCVICFDKGVIHFTDLAPSNKHEPMVGERAGPPRWSNWTTRRSAATAAPALDGPE